MDSGILVLDLEGRVARWNRAMEGLYGRRRGEVLGKTLAEVFPEAFLEALRSSLVMDEREEIANIYKLHLVTAHGRSLRVNVSIAPFELGSGVRHGSILIVDDVTARVRLEEQLQHAEKMASIGVLAAGVAHEINNPLAFIILAMTQIARALAVADRPELEHARLLAKEVEEANARIAHIVGELKLFTRIPEGSHATPVDVNRLVRTAVTLASAEIKRFGLVRAQYGDIPSAPGSYAALGPVFVSILLACAQNLQRAAPEGRELSVDVSTRAVGETVVVTFHDNGPGVAPDALPHLFEPFVADESPSGTAGLGLALAHDLVRRAGGVLTVLSDPARGTTFEVVLPLADGPRPV